MSEQRELDDTLERLAKATEAIGPTPGFSQRVMGAVAAAGPAPMGWLDAALRSSRRIVPVALLAAALATVWAARSSGRVNESLAASYGAMELDW